MDHQGAVLAVLQSRSRTGHVYTAAENLGRLQPPVLTSKKVKHINESWTFKIDFLLVFLLNRPNPSF